MQLPLADDLAHALRLHAGSAVEDGVADRFLAFLASDPNVFERSHAPGHFAASAWLVSPDGERVLLTRHRKLQRWLQLGGHADGDRDLVRVALREAEEESGLRDLAIDPAIFDLDCHPIPARGIEPAHLHYDVRYVVRATGSEAFVVSDESLELAWRPIHAMAQDPQTDESLRRMAQRWLARKGRPLSR
ncbi:MAG TPA: NUDIX hydrolase [Frateuria sp.]|uniref:NUDIX hydrolase n=1 Tax=Frateuria sp. TaxID=2211372 RepID=UPI002DE8FE91|nr:NUDIX hydrolase [Frateuria sp.]